jgi:hypothetical protein
MQLFKVLMISVKFASPSAICQLVDVLKYRHEYIYTISMVRRYRYIHTNYTCRDGYRIDTVASSIDEDTDHLCDQAYRRWTVPKQNDHLRL